MEWSLEVVVLPVSDIERAVAFYRDQVGFHLDHDTQNEQMHVVQLTPPGSGCSIVFGRSALPERDGSRLHEGAAAGGVRRRGSSSGAAGPRRRGERPDGHEPHADGGTFFGFQDPDGNSWAVQEIKARAANPLIPRDHSGLREWAGG